MKFKKLLIDHLEKQISSVDVDCLMDQLVEKDVITISKLLIYVEAVYYMQLILGKPDVEIMAQFYMVLKCGEEDLTKVNLMYMITITDQINKKSCGNFYA